MNAVSIPQQHYGQLIQPQVIREVVHAIEEHFSPEKIILFGSYANGTPTPDSDLDLLIIMPSDLPRHKRSVPIQLLFRPMPCSMDIFVYTPKEVSYWAGTVNHIITNALNTGKVLYERHSL